MSLKPRVAKYLFPFKVCSTIEHKLILVIDKTIGGQNASIEGILKAHTGEQRALILMEMLGTQSTVEVDSMLLQRVS